MTFGFHTVKSSDVPEEGANPEGRVVIAPQVHYKNSRPSHVGEIPLNDFGSVPPVRAVVPRDYNLGYQAARRDGSWRPSEYTGLSDEESSL